MKFLLIILLCTASLTSCRIKNTKYRVILTNLNGEKEVIADFYQSMAYSDCLLLAKGWAKTYPDATCVTVE